MRPFSLLVLLMAIALVLGEENFGKKQDENEDEGDGEELPKQERGKSINCSYIFDTKEKSRCDVHKSKYSSLKKKLSRATLAKNILIRKKIPYEYVPLSNYLWTVNIFSDKRPSGFVQNDNNNL